MEQEPQKPGELATQDVLHWIRIALAVGIVILGVLFILNVVSRIFDIKLWELVKVLALPITVGAAVPWINWLQKKREQDVEYQRAQDEALQAYLDQMSKLLTDTGLRSKRHWLDDARVTARARSLAILRRLDGGRKRTLLQFLYEAQLINKDNRQLDEAEWEKLGPDGPTEFEGRIVGLSGADLRNANLRHLNLAKAALDGAILEKADLRDSKLSNSDLGGTYLSEADLSNAELKGASLVNADLSSANLNGADLNGAQGVTPKQLDEAASLERTNMPNGQKYEEWLKDKKVITCKP